MRLATKRVTAISALAMVLGCSSGPDKKTDESAPAESPAGETPAGETPADDDTGTDEPVWVNAMYLTLSCKAEDMNQDLGQYILKCRLLTKEGKAVFPDAVTDNYKWGIDGLDGDSNIELTESTDSGEYSATFKVGKTTFVSVAAVANLKVTFNYVDKSSNKETVLDSRLNTIFKGLENQKYFRLVISSIRDHDPGAAISEINKIELKVDGSWLEMKFNPVTSKVELSGAPCVSNGDLNDVLLFTNITGQNTPLLRAANFPRFAVAAPAYDAAVPLTLSFGTGKAFSVTGFRYNGGQPLTGTNVPAGFPDVFRFESSPDQSTWMTVPGSSINIDSLNDADVLQYVWTGSEKKT